MFQTLGERLESVVERLRSSGRITSADLDATIREIRTALLEADVALPVVRSFTDAVRARTLGTARSGALTPAQQVIQVVHEELVAILGGETRALAAPGSGPLVILLAGLQGAGKTTLAGKLARWLIAQGHTPLLVACDLQRPSAVAQLQVVAERVGAEVYAPFEGSGVGDPVEVARTARAEAAARGCDVVILDTAGRLGLDEELMDQAIRIRDAASPDELLFVVDAMIGQDAVSVAAAFRDGVGCTGVVLTKLDGDARGGAALSVRHLTGAPILFVSTGEGLDEFDLFHPERIASRILGMGDMLTLIEQAEARFDHAQQAATLAKLEAGRGFDLEDFLSQMHQLRRLGPVAGLAGLLPGGKQIREAIASVNERDLDRIAAIISSMTPQERRDPRILSTSRTARVARGAGVEQAEVTSLVTRFEAARDLMSQFNGGGLPALQGAARSHLTRGGGVAHAGAPARVSSGRDPKRAAAKKRAKASRRKNR